MLNGLGKEPYWPTTNNQETHEKYKKILKLFEDKSSAIYSIHQLAEMGVTEGKEIGQWFGPNTVAQVLKYICMLQLFVFFGKVLNFLFILKGNSLQMMSGRP